MAAGTQSEVRLHANENPYGLGPKARQALAASLPMAWAYPGQEGELRAAIGALWGLPAQAVELGAGADDLLRRAVEATAGPVVSPWPSFGVYRSLAEARQRPFVPVPLDARGAPCLPALEEALKGWTGSSGTVFVANPNNPTGTSVPVEELRAVAARHPRWLWVVDEAYVEFSTQPRGFQACLPLPANVAVVRTFSKVYALAGLRVGYAVGEGWALKALGRLGDPMPVSRPALAAALGALEDTRRRDRVVRAVRGRREELSQGLQKRGFSVHPSETNFLLVEPPPEVSAEELYGALRREGIRVRRGADLGFPGHLRISVGSGPQHRRLWAVLDRYRMPSSAPSFEASS